jgi:hypothetical protein
MVDVLLVLVVIFLATVGTVVAVLALVLHALTVRNRVVPQRPSRAPITWLVAPELAARLHRRLRAAIAMASIVRLGAAHDLGLGLVDVVEQLEHRGVDLDEQLVLAAHAPRGTRRRMLRELQSEVAELERLAERTVRMARAWTGAPPNERTLAYVRERLDLLESALRELDGLDVVQLRSTPATPVRRRPFA